MKTAAPLADMTEKEWLSQVKELAQALGYKRAYHTFDSRRSSSGFPDLVLVRDRVIFLELKTERGKLSDQQKEWLRALERAGAEAYVVRPRHLELLMAVLRSRTPTHDRPWHHELRVSTRQEVAA
jgi:hypothetical protein